ncbi:MAG: hypothetical protein D8M59_02970 [Planctomycetes bacterium]|nr:hypothetical protein [Planctomycetota bacterium]NOG52958.1 xanthine dehydrogenase family protein [Planctomycetota bacterium]
MKRIEGISKLTGRERYVDDLPLEGFLWGATVRSPAARGRIKAIHFGTDIDWSQFVIVDHRDIPGPNEVAMIERDMPILAASEVRHAHEAILCLAHPDRHELRRAVASVRVEIEPEEPYLDFVAEPTQSQIQYGSDNVFKHIAVNKGDVEQALAEADVIIEGVYETGAQEHVYIEPQGMVAWEDDAGVLRLTGSLQCPYYVLNALMHGLNRTAEQVRVIQASTGGAFGGKEDYPSIIGLHTALLTLKAGCPVKMIYDRGEDLAATTKRHPSHIRHRTGFARDGRLLAQDIDIRLDAGAYVTLSPVVLSRCVIHAAGPYQCANVRINGQAVMTNRVPFGAFRGFGAPQSHFANERHMDAAARQLGIGPAELRRINLIRDGQQTATGQVINDGTDRVGLLDDALSRADYGRLREAHRAFNASNPYRRRGIGIATFHHGAGFTGSGEVDLASVVNVAGLADGRVEVQVANTEMGQGALTVLTQIAAARLGYDTNDIVIAPADTALVPNSGPTVASRTAMVVGFLIEQACDDLQAGVMQAAACDQRPVGAHLKQAIQIVVSQTEDHQPIIGSATYGKPPDVHWDEATYTGSAYGTYAWAAYVASVEVDLRTFVTTVTDFVAVQEIGTVLNEGLARGQIEGGVVQAIGWALSEECLWDEQGGMSNAQLTNYIIPTSCDVPLNIDVGFVENPYAYGAQGAKGIGELPMDGPAAAVLNAIADATGVNPTVVPMTPERLMELLVPNE